MKTCFTESWCPRALPRLGGRHAVLADSRPSHGGGAFVGDFIGFHLGVGIYGDCKIFSLFDGDCLMGGLEMFLEIFRIVAHV